MEIFIVNQAADYSKTCTQARRSAQSEILIQIECDVEHQTELRFAANKLIWQQGSDSKKYNYLIEISPSHSPALQKSDRNETSFYFGGEKSSLHLFSKLNFKVLLKEPFHFINTQGKDDSKSLMQDQILNITDLDEIPTENILLINIMHDSKITFFDCTFENNSSKNFVIRAIHDSYIQFVNCRFKGLFSFEVRHDAKIDK